MKNRIVIYSILFACILLTPGCRNIIEPPVQAPEGMGSFTLYIAGSGGQGRTILPNPADFTFVGYTLKFTRVGGASGTSSFYITVANSPVLMEAGSYTLEVTAYTAYTDAVNNKPAASGTLGTVGSPIVITAGGATPGTVTLKAISGTGSGTFSWDIGFPDGIIEAAMEIISLPAETTVKTINLLGATPPDTKTGSLSLASGQYSVIFTLKKDAGTRTVSWLETLHIYANMASSYENTFTDNYFLNNRYTVTYVSHDDVIYRQYGYFPGEAALRPDNPFRENYFFDDWYTASDGGSIWDFDTIISEDITLYARWSDYRRYVITLTSYYWYRATGGTLAPMPSANYLGNVIAAIEDDAAGIDCSIQFGNGTPLLLDTNSASIGGVDAWGKVTLLGSVTSSRAASYNATVGSYIYGTVYLYGNVSVDSYADIINTGDALSTSYRAICNNSTGTLTIYDGTVSCNNVEANGMAVSNVNTGEVIITEPAVITAGIGNETAGKITIMSGTFAGITNYSDGIVEILGGTGRGIRNNKNGKITISGTETLIESESTTSTAGVIMNMTDGVIEILGGTIRNTYTSASGLFNTIYNAPNGATTGTVDISGGTVIALTGRAIYNYGPGKITISGTETLVTSANSNASFGTIINIYGEIKILGGTVSNTYKGGNTGSAIFNSSTGTIDISGGTVKAETGMAIRNNSTGIIKISGTETLVTSVNTTSDSGTIYNNAGGEIKIFGGTVSNANTSINFSSAIFNNGTGNVDIGGGVINSLTGNAVCNYGTGIIKVSGTETLVTSAMGNSSHGTIYLSYNSTVTDTTLVILGGTVSNTAAGNAVYNVSTGAVEISGGLVIAREGYALRNTSTGLITLNNNGTLFAWGSAAADVANPVVSPEDDALIIAWDTANGSGSFTIGDTTGLFASPGAATVKWARDGTDSGISYSYNTNSGFIPITGATVQ